MEEITNEAVTAQEAVAEQTEKAGKTDRKCKKKRAVKAVFLVIVIALLLCSLCGSCFRKYDYAVMFSENAVATLNEVKQGGWDIINARWAADARGVWNYELIVRRPAPLFGIFGKKLPQPAQPQQAKPAPAPKQAPQAQPQQASPAPAPQAQPEAPKN